MNKFKNKGMGIIYGFAIILFHAVGHWLTIQYKYDESFHQFVINLKNAVFSYFNSNIPLEVTIGISGFMFIMMIISSFWKYSE